MASSQQPNQNLRRRGGPALDPLVTVFDNGDLRQYMDGVLVREDTYPSGSFTNVDLYKLGVNRRQRLF